MKHVQDVLLRTRATALVGENDDPPGRVAWRIDQALQRYHLILERQDVARLFTTAELDVLCDICWSWAADPADLIDGGILAELDDALEESFGPEVDRLALRKKVASLTIADQVCLVERIESSRMLDSTSGKAVAD